MAARSREQSESVADIGELPDVVDAARREACRLSLLTFLCTYFPNSTGLKPFSDDHRRVIDRIQRCILEGGRFCNAVYRGFAKTTISELAALWAVLYGHRAFVVVFGGDQGAADGIIDSIKRELSENDLLLEDFPEVCHAVRALEGKAQRQHSQSFDGKLTHIRWTADMVVLPSIPGSIASGAILCAYGLTGSIRGLKYKRPDGRQQRPDFAIVDDPQTDESAASALQCAKRLKILQKTILKSAGHNKSLAIVVNATVIEPDDLICQLLDPKKHAAWQGERIKLVKSWSKSHDTLWLKDYAELRSTYDADDPSSQARAHAAANEFYRVNRAAMDDGCEVSWEHCYDHDCEQSAIQHAYNSYIDDGPEVFASEFQNDPLPSITSSPLVTPDEVCRKLSGYARGVIPQDAKLLTGFVDIQKEVLYWGVVAWADGFTGYVVDYGTWPDQGRLQFTHRDPPKPLSKKYRGGLEAILLAACGDLAYELIANRQWIREDGAQLAISRLPFDANWGETSDTVYKFCAQSPYKSVVMPSHGKFVRASTNGLNEAAQKQGEQRGLNWRVPPLAPGKTIRHVVFDTNAWKSFLFRRLAIPKGDPGSLCVFDAPAAQHALFAQHVAASEYPVSVTAHGRTVEEFLIRPTHPDNDWLDVLTGCCVGASMQGLHLVGHRTPTRAPKKWKRREVQYA